MKSLNEQMASAAPQLVNSYSLILKLTEYGYIFFFFEMRELTWRIEKNLNHGG